MNATIIHAPHPIPESCSPSIFLAGSIEMGKAENWQERVIAALSDLPCFILNPRRPDWDSSWKQSKDDPQFRAQVEWELDALEYAEIIALYFAPGTQSPISLLELGLHAQGGRLVVCCPEGFWRKGNVDITCARYGVEQVGTLDKLIAAVRKELKRKLYMDGEETRVPWIGVDGPAVLGTSLFTPRR